MFREKLGLNAPEAWRAAKRFGRNTAYANRSPSAHRTRGLIGRRAAVGIAVDR